MTDAGHSGRPPDLKHMTCTAIDRSCTVIRMTSNACLVKGIRSRRHVLVSGFLMTVTAIVCLVIIDVVMAVQTIQGILLRVCLVSEQNLTGIILKH
jgi:hypothetical protein